LRAVENPHGSRAHSKGDPHAGPEQEPEHSHAGQEQEPERETAVRGRAGPGPDPAAGRPEGADPRQGRAGVLRNVGVAATWSPPQLSGAVRRTKENNWATWQEADACPLCPEGLGWTSDLLSPASVNLACPVHSREE